ncbi:MAG TPA: anti-sigma factor [Candidatus Limnocylindrales bacterium]
MTDVHSLSGAFVLDALDDRERAAFERHLEECDTCSLEVAELRETAARLADDVWSVPPPRLRQAVLTRVANTRQEAPRRAAAPARAPRTRRQSWRHRTTFALVAASLIALATIGGFYVVSNQRAAELQAKMDAVLEAPDVAMRTGQVVGGGHVTVYTAPSQDASVVVLAQAPSVNNQRAYQFWKIQDGKPASAGVLPAGRGDGRAYVPGMRGISTIALTVEDSDGAQQPTTPIVSQVALTS